MFSSFSNLTLKLFKPTQPTITIIKTINTARTFASTKPIQFINSYYLLTTEKKMQPKVDFSKAAVTKIEDLVCFPFQKKNNSIYTNQYFFNYILFI